MHWGCLSNSKICHRKAKTLRTRKLLTVPLVISLFLHLIFAVLVVLTVRQGIVEDDAISVEWVKLPSSARQLPRRTHLQPAQSIRDVRSERPQELTLRTVTPAGAPLTVDLPQKNEPLPLNENPAVILDKDLSVEADLISTPSATMHQDTPTVGGGHVPIQRGELPQGTAPRREKNEGAAIGGGLVSAQNGEIQDLPLDVKNPILVPEDHLGAVLKGKGTEIQGHIRLIRLKHSLSDWWQDPTAISSFAKWLGENTNLRADMKYAGGSLRLTDPRILDAPLIIMTGHDKDITVGRNLAKEGPLTNSFSPSERAALRKYIVEQEGMLFFDDCGFNGLFAAIVADELQTIFPEYPLEYLPHHHEIYTIYYQLPLPPSGGDVFWGSENQPKPTQFKYQKGITINKRLAVVYNRKDYMCAMETVEIESRTMLRLRRSTDVHRFMTNLLVYAMKYGGNTDRSEYKP